MRQLALAISPPPQPTLDNYVAGANAEALERVRAAAAGALAEGIVYLWGAAGSGRTHLLRAAAAAGGGAYCPPGEALPEAPPPLLALDDVDRLDAAAQARAFALVNAARETGCPVLAAGDTAPAGLALREDLRTRLGWGLVYALRPLADADAAAYLRAEAERRGLRMGDEVLDWLLTRLPRDLASLAAVLALLDRYSLERQRQVTLPLVREALHSETR